MSVKNQNRMTKSVDPANTVNPDETAPYEPSHQDLQCLHRQLVLVCRAERVRLNVSSSNLVHIPFTSIYPSIQTSQFLTVTIFLPKI